jgi:cardiolipin synthase
MELLKTLTNALYYQSILIWGWIGGFVYLATALFAAGHALLYKRNIRAATGWIGLIWFAPVLGIILYFLFGINRIKRRAKSRLEDHDPVSVPDLVESISQSDIETSFPTDKSQFRSLAHLGQSITRLNLVRGNRVEPLIDGKETYPAMIEAIDDAEQSITLCTYIFTGTGIGRQFIDALGRAHDRGIEIRVIIDDVGARYSSPSASQQLRNRGIPVRRFMRTWYPWKFRYLNLRNHRKIMVVDGTTGFTGGMNIDEKYWADDPRDSDGADRDVHFKVTGPVVSQLQHAFAEDWDFCSGEELSGPDWFPKQSHQGEVIARGIADGPDDDYDRIQQVLYGAIASAEDSIRIISPYFLPDEELLSALKTAALRGLRVDILTPKYNSSKLIEWAARPLLAELAENGCNVYLVEPPFNHSKLMVVDDYWTFLGSTNWDARSLKLNFEFNLECYDETLAREISAYVDDCIEYSQKISTEEIYNLPLPYRLRNNAIRLFSPYL